MARPPLDVGTFGEITVTHIAPSRYKARARFRDRDGITRAVARHGQTKTEATRNLRATLAERAQHGRIDGSATVRQVAALWLADMQANTTKAAATVEQYGDCLERDVLPAIGSLRLSEATTRACDDALRSKARQSASGAKTMRTVMRGIFALAAAYDAIPTNPMREVRSISRGAKPRKQARALTREQVDQLLDELRSDEEALRFDLPDLCDWMLATGCRIGEAFAVRDPVLDMTVGTIEINATALRLAKLGVVVQERPKTAAGHRVLALPPYAVAMLERRRGEIRFHPPAVPILDVNKQLRQEPMWLAFPSPLARSVRDRSNTTGDIRRILDRLGWPWVTSHTFRKTVATRLDEAGFTARQIADQLGHAHPSMTQDVYMGRKVVNARTAEVLER